MIEKPINCTEAHVPTLRYGMVVSELICCQTSIRRHATLFWKTSYQISGAQSSFHQITLNKASEFTCNFPKAFAWWRFDCTITGKRKRIAKNSLITQLLAFGLILEYHWPILYTKEPVLLLYYRDLQYGLTTNVPKGMFWGLSSALYL